MALYTIPTEEIPEINKFLALSDEQATGLAKTVETEKPSAPWEFVTSISKKCGIPEDDAIGILLVFFSIYRLRGPQTKSIDIFADEILESFQEVEEIRIPDEAKAKERLKQFLQFDKTLGVVAKASGLKLEFDRVFCSANIFSDIRPVFGDSPESPLGALVIHNLNIAFHEGRNHREFYVALTTDELNELATAVKRAQEKDRALKTFLQKSDLPCLKLDF